MTPIQKQARELIVRYSLAHGVAISTLSEFTAELIQLIQTTENPEPQREHIRRQYRDKDPLGDY